MKKILITQSNYIPWKGYFDALALVDTWVVYDDMQYTRRDWRNRNIIKTPQGAKWLTIPVEVKGKYFQKIKETKIADKSWTTSHWNTIQECYKNARYFREMSEWIEPLYRNCQLDYLTDVNLYFIQAIHRFLGIKTEIRFSSEFELAADKTERLVHICQDLHGTDYYSGPAAQAYMNVELFEGAGIQVHYLDYAGYPEYPQLYPPFLHGTCIWDLIFNVGEDTLSFMKQKDYAKR